MLDVRAPEKLSALYGRGAVAHYTVKIYNTQARLVGKFEFSCLSDKDAEDAARRVGETRTQELWCGARRVRIWPAAKNAA